MEAGTRSKSAPMDKHMTVRYECYCSGCVVFNLMPSQIPSVPFSSGGALLARCKAMQLIRNMDKCWHTSKKGPTIDFKVGTGM